MHVTFTVAGRELVAPLDHVREVVRGRRVERMPGFEPPFVGALQLRGVTVPVADARPVLLEEPVDIVVLVLPGSGAFGVIVDRVLAVTEDLAEATLSPAPEALPVYVIGLLEHGGTVTPMVDLRILANEASVGRARRAMAASRVSTPA
jgi:chemotaxis signal transduction protein